MVLTYVSLVQALQKIHETFQSDMEAESNRIGQLESLAQELSDYHYYNADAVNARMQVCVCACVCMYYTVYVDICEITFLSPPPQSIKDTAAHLSQLADGRSQRIQEAIERQQQLDELRLNFAKKAAVSHC